MGVPVEAELGKVGGKEDDGPAVEGESPYTDPAEAKEFVERTGCTSLAIGVGTSTVCTRAIRTSSSPWSRPSATPSTCRWFCTAPPVCPMSRLPRL